MKLKLFEQILEKCNKIYKEQDMEKEVTEKQNTEGKIEEKCKTYKECQCEITFQEAFFAINYK